MLSLPKFGGLRRISTSSDLFQALQLLGPDYIVAVLIYLCFGWDEAALGTLH